MPPTGPLEERIAEVKTGLAARWTPLTGSDPGDLSKVLTYEPIQAKTTPLLSIMFGGFRRASLESPSIAGTPLQDPLGGRDWVFDFDVRLWVDLIADEEKAQTTTDKLVPLIVAALEDDRQLDSLAVDSAIVSGATRILTPGQGQALLIHTMKCSVEIEETL